MVGEPIRLRAHHGMCLSFFEGNGYSRRFTRHMQSVSDAMQRNPMLLLVTGGDVICQCCPNFRRGACRTAELVRAYDQAVLSCCGLAENTRLRWDAFSRLVREKILLPGRRAEICGTCQWTELCAAAEADAVGTERPVP